MAVDSVPVVANEEKKLRMDLGCRKASGVGVRMGFAGIDGECRALLRMVK